MFNKMILFYGDNCKDCFGKSIYQVYVTVFMEKSVVVKETVRISIQYDTPHGFWKFKAHGTYPKWYPL